MTREERLEEVVERLVAAMKKSVDQGSTDHLDCHEDGGAFWYDALEEARRILDEDD